VKLKLILGIASSFFLLWALSTVVLAQGETPAPYTGLQNPFPWTDNVTQAAGKAIYQLSCQGCHGAPGNSISVADFSSSRYSNTLIDKPDFYFWTLSEGRLERGMPAYVDSLSANQRWQVLTYVWAIGAGPGKEPSQKVSPALEHGALPDCFRCHTRVLKGHDKLGTGSAACLVCHSSTKMGMLRLFSGIDIPQSESPKLCAQCHPDRSDAWQKGTHGVLARTAGTGGIPTNVKPKCADCHEPHQPSLALAIGTALPSLDANKEGKLDCLSCHVRVLTGHDKLGAGSAACWSCHLSTEMTTFHLAGGDTRLSAADSTKLCAQCHQLRYQAWNEGTHGIPAWKEGEPQIFGSEKVPCVNCHEPHQPQVPLINITKPHPAPTPAPPEPPLQLLSILGISLLVTIGLGIAVTRGESQ